MSKANTLMLKGNAKNRTAEPSQRRRYAERLLGATRADRLIKDVLAYSKISRQDFRLQPVDLELLIREIIEQYPEFRSPHAEIKLQSPLLRVMAHDAMLGQCVTNLLSNAVKFVAPGAKPAIKIWTESTCGQVRIWFEDNGIGIEAPNLARIFAIFERVHSDKDYDGTGIGLAIVRRGVERMGGLVGVESVPGQGSRFWIQLNPDLS